MSIEAPGDLLLPEPEEQKEVDLFRAIKDNSVQVRNALVELGDREDTVKASSGDATAGYLDAKVDDVTIEVATDKLQVKDDGIDKTKIAADLAGLGITQAVGGELDVNVDDSTIEIDTDTVRVKADGLNETHVRLQNNAYLTSRNAADDGDVDVIKVNGSDVAIIPDGTETATNAAPTSDNDVANKKYVDDNSSTSGHEIFTANGTFTAPAGVTKVFLTMVGGGGSGGSSTYPATPEAGGGGGGGTIINRPYTVTPAGEYTVVIGASNTASTFDGTVSAPPGNSGSSAGVGTGGLGGSGDADGSTAPGLTALAGGKGGDTISGNISGGGGSTMFGVGGDPVLGNNLGLPGETNTGAGGSGGVTNGAGTKAGGAGGTGLVIVMY